MRRVLLVLLLVVFAGALSVPGAQAATGSSLSAAGSLATGQALRSPNARYLLVMQTDGNLVVYGGTGHLWNSATRGAKAVLSVQADGNLVIRAGGQPVWSSRTVGTGSADRLVMQDDGNLVLYGAQRAVWVNGRVIPPPAGLPVDHLVYGTGTATQAVLVTAPSYGSSYATLETFSRGAGGWSRAMAAMPARIGWLGFAAPGTKREGDGRSPTGRFGFGPFMWGAQPDPGVHYPYRRLVAGDWWDEHVGSPTYNTWRYDTRRDPPFAAGSERLWQVLPAYDEAATIAYNTSTPVQGLGSGIFLHVGTGGPTAGCVSLAPANLVAVLRWLRPGAGPLVAMGVRAVVLR